MERRRCVGYIHDNVGEYRQAVCCYRNALELYRRLGSRHPQADTLSCAE
jgi:hypothetical protein